MQSNCMEKAEGKNLQSPLGPWMKVDGPSFMVGSSFIGYHGDMDVNMGRSMHGKIFTSGREESWKATTKLQRLTGALSGDALPSMFPI